MPYLREIIQDGHPTLRKVAKKVDPKEINSPLFQQMIDDMFRTMYEAPGVGLAAPQINISKRVFVMDVHEDPGHPEHEGQFTVINPKIELAEDEAELTEGCLSVVGKVGEILRYDHVVVTGLDRYGKKIRLEGRGLFAECLQHEIDHLNGVLYIDKAKNIRDAHPDDENENAGGDVESGAVQAAPSH